MCRLAGKEWIGSSEFVQAEVDSVMHTWVLISASEALLAAKQGHYSCSTYFHGNETLWWCFRGNHEMRAQRKTGACSYLHFVCESSTWLVVVSLGELQGRGGSQELLCVLIAPDHS